MGFDNLGYQFVLIVAILARPVVALACLLPVWIRISKNGDPTASSSIFWSLAAVIGGPLYLLGIMWLSSQVRTTTNIGLIGLLPIPVASIGCSIVGVVQSFRSQIRAAKVASIVLTTYLALETILISLYVLPHLN